jgi:hypothetical protein
MAGRAGAAAGGKKKAVTKKRTGALWPGADESFGQEEEDNAGGLLEVNGAFGLTVCVCARHSGLAVSLKVVCGSCVWFKSRSESGVRRGRR